MDFVYITKILSPLTSKYVNYSSELDPFSWALWSREFSQAGGLRVREKLKVQERFSEPLLPLKIEGPWTKECKQLLTESGPGQQPVQKKVLFLQSQKAEFSQQPECTCKWIFPQSFKIRAQPLLSPWFWPWVWCCETLSRQPSIVHLYFFLTYRIMS